MQTLGLASEIQPTDGMMKRLFWPTISNQYDVDLVGQQGFWVCVIVAILSVIMVAAMGSPLLGLLIGITYFLAGTGVRERSIAAAVLIFACYLLDRIAGFEMYFTGAGGGNPLLGLVGLMLLLFANVRATMLSKRWSAPDAPLDVSELPERSDSSFFDKVANRMPAAVWPKARYVFYPLAGLLLVLSILSVIFAGRERPKPLVERTPSATLEVSPPR